MINSKTRFTETSSRLAATDCGTGSAGRRRTARRSQTRDHQHPEPQLVAHREAGELEEQAQKEDAGDQ
jgi:hypothetical protein